MFVFVDLAHLAGGDRGGTSSRLLSRVQLRLRALGARSAQSSRQT